VSTSWVRRGCGPVSTGPIRRTSRAAVSRSVAAEPRGTTHEYPPSTIGFVLHLALGVDCVTVFGKRSLAQMAFSLRKARARAVLMLLRERVQEAQERERRRAAESAPPVPG